MGPCMGGDDAMGAAPFEVWPINVVELEEDDVVVVDELVVRDESAPPTVDCVEGRIVTCDLPVLEPDEDVVEESVGGRTDAEFLFLFLFASAPPTPPPTATAMMTIRMMAMRRRPLRVRYQGEFECGTAGGGGGMYSLSLAPVAPEPCSRSESERDAAAVGGRVGVCCVACGFGSSRSSSGS